MTTDASVFGAGVLLLCAFAGSSLADRLFDRLDVLSSLWVRVGGDLVGLALGAVVGLGVTALFGVHL